MNPSLMTNSSDGLCVNMCAILIELCGPFIDPLSELPWKRIENDYMTFGGKISFKDDTKLVLIPEDEEILRDQVIQRRENKSYHFICECFFMTIKMLHLGTVKVILGMTNIVRRINELTEMKEECQKMLER